MNKKGQCIGKRLACANSVSNLTYFEMHAKYKKQIPYKYMFMIQVVLECND
jgi:hypothetical protein